MVNNKLKVLDEGQNKFVPEVIEMKKPEYVYKFENEITEMNCRFHEYEAKKCLYKEGSYSSDDLNELYRRCEEYKNNEFLFSFLFETEVNSRVEFNKIAKYYNIIPFTPSVMINISPNWGDKCRGKRIQCLKQLIDNYLSEGWYDKWSYVIECGSEGTHIHAHMVCHLNVTRLKSAESHVGHNNQRRQLQKWAAKIEGMRGLIEGVSVQSTILRNETLVSDKLDYLIEDKKPPGHKNHHVIKDGFVSGEL